MPRYLYRVAYTYTSGPDAASVDGAIGSTAYEPIVVIAATEAEARAEVDGATERYPRAVGATKTVTLVSTT